MTHHFVTTTRPKAVAKLLRQKLDQFTIKKQLNECLELTAHAYGHATWNKLVADAGKAEPSKDDHEVGPEVRAERRKRAIGALVAGGVSLPIAEKIVDDLALTARVDPAAEKLPADAILRPLAGLPCFREKTGKRAEAILAVARELDEEQVALTDLAGMLVGSARTLVAEPRNVDHLRMRSWPNVGEVWQERMGRVVSGIPAIGPEVAGREDIAHAFGLDWNRLLDPEVDLKATVGALVEAHRAGGTMADLVQIGELYASERPARRRVPWAEAIGSDLVQVGQVNLIGSDRSHLGGLVANAKTQTALVNLFCMGDDITSNFMAVVASLMGRTTLVQVYDGGAEEPYTDIAELVSLTADEGPIQDGEQFADINGVHDVSSLAAYLGIPADQLRFERFKAGSINEKAGDVEPRAFFEAVATCLPWIAGQPEFARQIEEGDAPDCLDQLMSCYATMFGPTTYMMDSRKMRRVANDVLNQAVPKPAMRLN
jgi:hypothetical protein